MQIKQVRRGRTGQQRHEVVMRAPALLKPCPEVRHPRTAPPGLATSGRQTRFKASARRHRKFWCLPRRYLSRRMQREQVREVPVFRLRLGVGFQPLLKSTVRADAVGGKSPTRRNHPLTECIVDPKDLGRLDATVKQLPDDLRVHRRGQA